MAMMYQKVSFSVWNQIFGKLKISFDSILDTNLPKRKHVIEKKLPYLEEEENEEDTMAENKI